MLRALDEERATDDPLNGLILSAGLSWRDVELLRTLRNHLLQVRPHWNADTVNGVLVRNSQAAGALYQAFAARFDPGAAGDRGAAVAAADAAFTRALDSVRSLAEDEVLRALANLVRAALRTNAFQRPERPVFSVKVDCRAVEAMPSPRPLYEIYVHSRRLEGIHLRGGKVARGGIRWSDRHDDFRTEILGLMKTQMVKNSVIVPVGSKGGFVLKGDVPPRPALDEYLIDRYREFVSGLLDVTDNRADGKVLHPPEVVRLDGDDPYLVVAADKGTAHLSDTANSVSAQYGFWLGDAFASGGSAGYDHKKMGITARGAWECVRHHFRNLGIDVQTQPITRRRRRRHVGRRVRQRGAAVARDQAGRGVRPPQHLHRPRPRPARRASSERERMFALARSSWRDYDTKLLSAGGGVYDRSAKAIALSAEARRLLEIEAEAPSGEEVIRKILTARVDLLYNGGIGTYVKAESEEHGQVGDRANDRVRVNGRELRARVVGEGGNLGLTQKGRLEYWAAGGPAQHRRGRQLGRRRHLRPRGEHQDPARHAGQAGPGQGPRRAQPDPGGDDRRRGAAGARGQRRPGAGAEPRQPAQRAPLRGVRGARRRHGGRRPAQPPGRVGPVARGAAREPAARARAAAAAAVRAARLLEDVRLPAAARDRLPGQRRRAGPSSTPTSRACCASASRPSSRSTCCGARSWRPRRSTTW